MKRTRLSTWILCLVMVPAVFAEPGQRWSEEKAAEWYKQIGWQVGCNFIPSTAINQLEMWQADTFDPKTIERELGWAASLGFNSVRVFLHHLCWEQDREGFLKRMDEFLAIADRHKIKVMFVPLDGVWDPFPKLGRQREPRPHVHNSGWVQSPGAEVLRDPARHDEMEGYIRGVIEHFKSDRRVCAWDLFNEPENPNKSSYGKVELPNKAAMALALLEKSFRWARQVNPAQPLTSGVWMGNWPDAAKLSPMERLQLEQSDIISFHTYNKLEEVKPCVENLRRYKRPILCTEYMSRGSGSTFDPLLDYLKEHKVAAYNWGLVNGKTQTIYPWDSWTQKYTAEPKLWFHDIFRSDGRPYDVKEVENIKDTIGN